MVLQVVVEIGTLRCMRCLTTSDCGKVCQAISWQQHKGPCKAVAAAKEANNDDSVVLCAAGCGQAATLRCSRCLGAGIVGKNAQHEYGLITRRNAS